MKVGPQGRRQVEVAEGNGIERLSGLPGGRIPDLSGDGHTPLGGESQRLLDAHRRRIKRPGRPALLGGVNCIAALPVPGKQEATGSQRPQLSGKEDIRVLPIDGGFRIEARIPKAAGIILPHGGKVGPGDQRAANQSFISRITPGMSSMRK